MLLTPDNRNTTVLTFCRQIVSNRKPVYVPHQPLADEKASECFHIIPQHVATHGGEQCFGWTINEFRRCWLEAEFHVVWKRKDGVFINLTPRSNNLVDKILFLPDSEKKYKGVRVESVFYPLNSHPAILRIIKLAGEGTRIAHQRDIASEQHRPSFDLAIAKINDEVNQLIPMISQMSQ